MRIFILVLNFFFFINCQKDPDESLPYEFGFTIDGQQHRHEKKDVNGIIQGEFGFITADGIYHVTVYATDENGNFRILSMKNIRISAPLDGSPLPKGAKIESYGGQKPSPQPNALQIPLTTTPATAQGAFNGFTTQSTIKPACGGCGYVTTPKPKPGLFKFDNPVYQPIGGAKPSSKSTLPTSGGQNPEAGVSPGAVHPNQPEFTSAERQPKTFPTLQNQPTSQQQQPNGGSSSGQSPAPYGPQSYPDQEGFPPTGQDQSSFSRGSPPNSNNQPLQRPYEENEALPNPLSNDFVPSTPGDRLSKVTVSDGAIHVPGNPDIPIVDKYPGMKDGLPNGITENDITDLLYKFNYTVGFHGHYEKGLKSGAKVGGYFVNGRDGVSRVVTYVADENGFRPKFKFIRLGLDSADTPKEETEKSFGLKNFEFIWYPIS